MERSRDLLVPGGNTTTRYQRLDIGTGWCYHPVLMDPSILVSASQVTSKEKYLPLSHNIVVDEVVKKIHMKQEVTDSNPSHYTVPYCQRHFFQ